MTNRVDNITLEDCKKSALECKSIVEWKQNYPNEYVRALKMGWNDGIDWGDGNVTLINIKFKHENN